MCPNQSVELIKVDTFRIRGILKIIFANTTNITRSTRGDEGHERRRANNNNPGLHHVKNAFFSASAFLFRNKQTSTKTRRAIKSLMSGAYLREKGLGCGRST